MVTKQNKRWQQLIKNTISHHEIVLTREFGGVYSVLQLCRITSLFSTQNSMTSYRGIPLRELQTQHGDHGGRKICNCKL